MQVDLIDCLRTQTISTINHGAKRKEDVAALIALAIYEPLLLIKGKDEIQLDGLDIGEAAFTACLALDLHKTPSMVQLPSSKSPCELIQICAIWISIAFITDYHTMMGGTFHRNPFQVSREELAIVQSYCQESMRLPGSSSWSRQASFLLILIFRYQTLQNSNKTATIYLNVLQDLPTPHFIEARICLEEFTNNWREVVGGILDRILILRDSLCELIETISSI